jgi:hypothetical protein
MSSARLVSVVTPVYNGEFYLRVCIESVLAQNTLMLGNTKFSTIASLERRVEFLRKTDFAFTHQVRS